MAKTDHESYAARLADRWTCARACVLEQWMDYRVNAACKTLKISKRTFQRDISRARMASTFEDWRPRRRGPEPGHRTAKPIYAVIERLTFDRAKQKRNYAKLWRDVCHELTMQGFKAVDHPSASVVQRISKEIIARNRAFFSFALEGRPGLKAMDVIEGHAEAERPLHIVQIDHTPLDQITLASDEHSYLFRPYETAAVDLYTGVCLACFISPFPPSSQTVALCIAMIVSDKTELMKRFGVPGPWAEHGVPQIIHVDNAKEFHADAIRHGAGKYGIEIRHEWPGYPERKGKVERFWSTLNEEIHTWEGTTLSNVEERKKFVGLRTPNMTFQESQRRLLLAVQEYNNENYGKPVLPPVERWRRAGEAASFRRQTAYDPRRCYIDFLPHEERQVRYDGIGLAGCRYVSQDLLRLRQDSSAKYLVHYDPRDLSRIYIPYGNEILEIPRTYPTAAPVDQWELKRWKSEQSNDARQARNQKLLAEVYAAKSPWPRLFEPIAEPTEEEVAALRATILAKDPKYFERLEEFHALKAKMPLFGRFGTPDAPTGDDLPSASGKPSEPTFAPTPLKPRVI